jgi:hypothetical protein
MTFLQVKTIEMREAGSPSSPVRLRAAGVREQCQQITDRPLSAGGFWQGQMGLDAVAIAAAVLVLDDVAGFGEVSDDGKGPALGDAQCCGDVTQAYPGIVGDAGERPGVTAEEAPLLHVTNISLFWKYIASFLGLA